MLGIEGGGLTNLGTLQSQSFWIFLPYVTWLVVGQRMWVLIAVEVDNLIDVGIVGGGLTNLGTLLSRGFRIFLLFIK